MKKFYPCVCIPSSGQVKAKFAISLAGLAGYFACHPLTPETTEQGMQIFLLESSLVHDNREKLVRRALARPETTHIVFIDDDIAFPASLLNEMAAKNLPFLGTNYPFRKPHSGFTAGNLNHQPLQTTAETTGLEEILWCGFGFCVIAREIFEKIPEPWFAHNWAPEIGGFTTEDVPLCNRIREAGYRLFIDHDASKQLLHIGTYEYAWNDPLIVGQNVVEPIA